MNRHGLALQCVRFFFHSTAASAFKSFIKNSIRLCQLAVLPHSWLQIHPFCLDFHNMPRGWRSNVFLTILYLCWAVPVLCEDLDTKPYCIQKISSIILKHLALIRLVDWLLNKMFKDRMRVHRQKKMWAPDMPVNGNALPSCVILYLKIRDSEDGKWNKQRNSLKNNITLLTLA